MQGVAVIAQNPQQGSPPPNTSIATSIDMDGSLESNRIVSKDKSEKSDSGIFSSTHSSDQMDLSSTSTRNNTTNCSNNTEHSESDDRSDCSSPERKYFCPICDTILTSQHEFTLHIRSHNNESEIQDTERGFVCRICNKILSSSSSLDRHVLVHSGERPFNCKYCGDSFTTNGNMHRHMRTHKPDSYESDGSSDSTGSKIEYNNNKVEKEATSLKRKAADTMDLSNKKHSGDSVDESESDNNQQHFECPVCHRTDFDSLLILKTHLEDNHAEYPAKCDHCQQIFPNNKQLISHRNSVHDNLNSKHPVLGFRDLTFVDFSSEKFKHIARYECEKNLHKVTGNLKFQCKKCSRGFPCLNSLDIHEQDCTSQLDLTKSGLDLTKSTSMTETDIRRNEFFSRLDLQDNSPEKSPPLPVITKPEIQTNNKLRQQLLGKHLNIEGPKDLADIQSIISMTTNESLFPQLQSKPHDVTSKSYAESIESKDQEEESQDFFAIEFRKMKIRGEFPCRLCTAVYPNLRALKGHNRAHLNGNNNGTYRCNMCPHSSFDKAALIRHMRTHNGDRPYECSLCNYAFTTKANCERHLRNRHAKNSREEVKKAIIYHPSEDPTNDELNKLAAKDKDECKKITMTPMNDITKEGITPERVLSSTPKLAEISRSIPEPKPDLLKPDISPLMPNLQLLKGTLSMPIPKERPPTPKIFPNVNDIIKSENLKTLREHKILSNYSHIPYDFASKLPNLLTTGNAPLNIPAVTSNHQDSNYDSQSEDEFEQEEPLDLVLDLSKKKSSTDEKIDNFHDDSPQDLSKKSNPQTPQVNVNELFAQQLLKTPPKLDPAALYAATQLSMYQRFPGFPNWPNFPLNPMMFPALPSPILNPEQEMKERLKLQLSGGQMISDNFAERLQTLQHQAFAGHKITPFNGLKEEDIKPEINIENNFMQPKNEISQPLSVHLDGNFGDGLNKLRSPLAPPKQEIIHSPNSVKMVIKNGVLMPKQKQRRYRTERPFTCEHCSARFTLRSNMERHIKQQHPQFWSQRQRGNVGNPGRKSHSLSLKPNYCDINVPSYDLPKNPNMEDTKEQISEKIKFAILAQHLKNQAQISQVEIKREDDDDQELVIDENEMGDSKQEDDLKVHDFSTTGDKSRILEEKLRELHARHSKTDSKSDENQDLVPVSRLLDNASQQQFKEYFKRDREEPEVCGGSEEDEEGLVASGSTSEGNVSGTDENRSECETAAPVKKKSAYSLAPNRVSCPYCSRKFPWTSSLRRHILTHTGQKPFKCSHCPLLFTTKSNCDRHLLRKHGNTATTISTEYTTNSVNNYLMRNVPERPFKCSNCPSSTFSTYSNLKKHITCKHVTKALEDDIKAQGYEAGSSEDEKINQDNKTDWENQISIPKLPIANQEIPNSQVQNSDLPFKCHLCEGSFSERQDALDHIRDKHASEYDLLMSKNALDLNATTPDETAHNEEEDGEVRGKFPDYSNRKVICAFCMRRFWSAEDLRRHMRTHTGERPFSCDICRRRFTLKHSMLRHRKKHNVNFDHDTPNSDEDQPLGSEQKRGCPPEEGNDEPAAGGKGTDESDGNEGGSDLISNLLGIGDRSLIDKVLTASADDAAKMLGVKNGVKE